MDSAAQNSGRASHKVTVERTAHTRVTGPVSVPIRPQNVLTDTGSLRVESNVPLLKFVYALVEPDDGGTMTQETEVAVPLLNMRQIYSSQEWVHPATMRSIDLKQVVQNLPADLPEDGDPLRRLVVTITE